MLRVTMAATARGTGGRIAQILGSMPWIGRDSDVEYSVIPEDSDAKSRDVPEVKSNLLPRLNGVEYEFFSNDGGSTSVNLIGTTSLAFAAYWYCGTRWRAQKIAEAPLMVVKEDQTSGSEEWVPTHPLVDVLDNPSPDYDMGDLLERTSHYLDDGCTALWVLDRDRGGRVRRIALFKSSEFEVKSSSERLYALFRVKTATGYQDYEPEECCYFPDASAGWKTGKSRLDIALTWLQLGERARETVRDLLANSVWPSLVVIPDKDWSPQDDDVDKLRQEVEKYGRSGNKGRPFLSIGGGTVQQVAAKIRDLVPTDVLNRVESVVSAILGVPAIVLQFQVGMENSPWSQMEQARRMAYDDTIQPAWRQIERVLTRQLLRPSDDDKTLFIRFDRSNIAALQLDRAAAATTASVMGKATSVNERRSVMGLEPASKEQDPEGRADIIPELQPAPSPLALPAANPTDAGNKARKQGSLVLLAALRKQARDHWEGEATRLLRGDAHAIERIVRDTLVLGKATAPNVGDVLDRIDTYLRAEVDNIAGKWGVVAIAQHKQGIERAIAVVAADLGIGYNVLFPFVVDFAEREAGKMIRGIANTTRADVASALARALDAHQTVEDMARSVAKAGAFAPDRAMLIARTESARAFNGGPTDALAGYSASSKRVFTKTWSGLLDGVERDSHIAMEGEVQYVENNFSNGMPYPNDFNERCGLVFNEVIDA